ncbi:TIGR03032 family protein [Spirulina sp. CS-785/01]|uniref:TIGR03032 family protein n=1 Tax=Spirulina sp. CS-785/01 TaxID=3021716 RepID=UPI00232FC5C0|nr:TIGR03032 family protein [Spirulina sp. CS-785/01]MDB9312683.1 TIGR03032 family protein [Spirulina sp. CS-785/01]
MTQAQPPTGQQKAPPLAMTCSRQFIPWLQEQHFSIAFTTYQTNRLFLLGLKPDGVLSIFERLFDRPMGLFATPERLYMSSRFQLWQLDNALEEGEEHKGYDKLYVPRMAYTTGDLDIHDLVLLKGKRIVFANTLYSCLGTVSDRYSFAPLWQPPFISKLAPEDRCHLNGIALVDDKPRYLTAVSRSDVAAGWRQKRQDGGCLIDIYSNQVLLDSLSMPHSPRWYQNRLWLLNSGTGDFGYFDFKTGQFQPLTFCPGYLRGLAFHKDWAVVGLSKPRREDQTFAGLALDERLAAKNASAGCGLLFINLKTGNIDHWLQIEGIISELYDVQLLPGVRRPMALGFKTDEICKFITIAPTPKTSVKSRKNQPMIQDAPPQESLNVFPTQSDEELETESQSQSKFFKR